MVARPPPLQLRDDNTRFGRRLQSRSASKSPSILSRLYESSWRPLIIIVATINAVRYFCSVLVMTDLWRELDLNDNSSLRSRQLRSILLALGIMYSLTGMIELFGGISALMRRLRLIRVYTHLVALSAVLVTCAGILVAVTHFVFADEIIQHCMSQAQADKSGNGVKLILRSTPTSSSQIESTCLNTWSSRSSFQILGIFLCYLLPSAIYCLVVYTYYCQSLDPLHPASLYSQTLTQSGKHPYAKLVNDPPTAYTVSIPDFPGLPIFGHYRNGMCGKHRPDGSMFKGKVGVTEGRRNQDVHAHQHHHHRRPRSARLSSHSASPYSHSHPSASATSSDRRTSGRRTRVPIERTRSDRSDRSMVTVSPGPPSYSGVVYDATYPLGEYYLDPPQFKGHNAGIEGKFIN